MLIFALVLWNGVVVAPENRCSPYDRDDYSSPQSVELEIIARDGSLRTQAGNPSLWNGPLVIPELAYRLAPLMGSLHGFCLVNLTSPKSWVISWTMKSLS